MSDTAFHLQRVETPAGPLALVTIDNGEDWTKPPSLGRSALESGQRLLDELESGDWAAAVFTGKPFWFCAGADINEFPHITPEDRKSTRLNSSHIQKSRMPSSA